MSKQRTNRWARRLPLLSILAILLIGLIAFRLQGSLQEHLRHMVAWELSRTLGRRVQVEECRPSVQIPHWRAKGPDVPALLQLSIVNLSVEHAPGTPLGAASASNFLQIPHLAVDLRLSSLLTGKGVLSSLHRVKAVHPELNLVRDTKGEWNFQDLLAGEAAPPKHLAAQLEMLRGRVSFQDFSSPGGLAVPQSNFVEEVDLSLFASRTSKSDKAATQLRLRLSGVNPEDKFNRVFISGQALNYPAASEEKPAQSEFNGSIVVSGADLGYLWQYGALAQDIKIARGRGDLSGYFLIERKANQPAALDYALSVTVNKGEVRLPWVAGEAEEVSGRVRAVNGLVQFAELKGRLGDTRLKGEGYLVLNTGADPSAEQCHSFRFHADGAQGKDIARVLPSDVPPALLHVPANTALGVSIVGCGAESTIFGEASVPQLKLAGTKDALPHSGGFPTALVKAPELAEARELQANFIYSDEALAAAGKAVVMGGEVKGAVLLPPSGKARFAVSLAHVSLPDTSPSASTGLAGEVWGNLGGEFSTRAESGELLPAVAGDIALMNGAVASRLDGERLARLPIERFTADFSYTKGELLLSRARAETGYGLIEIAGRLSADNSLSARLEGEGLDLAELGRQLGEDISGTAFFSARLGGTTARPQVELRYDIFAGGIRGYEYDWLRGDALLIDKEVPHFALTFQRGSGEGRFKGRASLPAQTDPGELFAQGRIEKARLEEWLPARFGRQAKGVFDSDIEVRGSPRSPEIEADINMNRPQFANIQFDQARGNLVYHKGVLSLPFFVARVNGAQLAASGIMRPDGELAFDFFAEHLQVAALLSSQPPVPVDGWLTVLGSVQGPRASPRLDMDLDVEGITLANRPAGDIEAVLSWQEARLEIEELDFAARGGHVKVHGNVTRDSASPAKTSPWQAQLKTDFEGMEVGFLLDLLERGLQANASKGRSTRLQDMLAKIPRPARGFLTASAALSGPLSALKGDMGFVLADASLAAEHLPFLEGEISFSPRQLTIDSFTAKEQEAYAEAYGEVEFAGDTNLNIDVHNLGAEVLSPWVEGVSGLGGSADMYLQVMGPTLQPTIRGDLEVADPTFANTRLERIKIDRFIFSGDRLDIENLRLVKGPHLASISASLPYSWKKARLEEGPLWSELSLKNQDLAFISALWPGLGEFAGLLNASFQIGGTTSSPRLEEGFAFASGEWKEDTRQAKISLDSRVVNHSLQLSSATSGPGLIIAVGRARDGRFTERGRFTASGSYDPFAGPPRRWGFGRYDIALVAERLEANIGSMIKGRVDANMVLRGEPGAPVEDTISGEARISRAKVVLPREKVEGEFSWRPRFSPELDIKVRTDDISVSTRMARVEFSGEGIIGGRLGYEPLALDMEFKSKRGVLDFPTAVAEVQRMDVTVTKEPDEELRALGRVEATARVGRHRIDLIGGGVLFPESELRITATATPPLASEAHATALLLGVPPGALGSTGTAAAPADQALGEHVAQSLSSSVTTIAAAGLSAPLLKAAGLNELSFAVSPVATRLQLGKRLAKKIYIYYLSSLSGVTRSTLLRAIFDITPEFSVGVSVNELEQHRFEIQNTKSF